jgi:hypothetical protein
MLLGTGVRKGDVSHAIHRQVAEHYDLPFVDIQAYLFAKLKERDQTWDDISIDFVENDGCHLNDYGNRLCFEAIKECFDDQVRLFWEGKRKARRAPAPPPLFSDELQYTRLVEPAKGAPGLTLEGNWARKPEGHVPWYFDSLLAGRPGAKLTLEFEGTAVAVFGLMYHNGLKLEAVLDGKEIAGPYLRHFIEFGKGMVLAHGLPGGKHVLQLAVSQPSRRHNKLAHPTAAIGYIGIAGKAPAAPAA